MIKRYKQFNEGIKKLLKGPTEEEVWKNFEGMTPDELLSVSSKINFVKGVEKALEDGAELNSDSTQESFRYAIFKGSIDVAIFLIYKGIDLYYRNGLAFQHAIEGNFYELVKLMLEKGINFQKDELEVYYTSARRRGFTKVSELIKNYINKKKWYNNIFKKTNESIKDLLVGPTEEEVFKEFEDKKPIDILYKSISGDFLEGVIYAVEHGANVNDHKGRVLKNASTLGNYEIVKYLLKNGADPTINNFESLKRAEFEQHKDVIELLKQYIRK